MRPIVIPATTPLRYLSFHRALNLRLPGEETGDWHWRTSFFTTSSTPETARLAGEGEELDTTFSLGARGVREMGDVLRGKGVPVEGTVHVASHPRAIADLVMLDLLGGREPMMANVRAINAWLDTEAQIDELRRVYIVPLRGQLAGRPREILDAWLPSLRFE